jgi:iron complex outermembrane receptor protein
VVGAYYKNLSRSVALDLIDGGLLLGAPGDLVQAGVTKDETIALYGEGYYQINERLKATVGLRWSTDNVAFPESETVGPTATVLSTSNLSGSYTAVTPKVGLAFQQNPNVLLYADIAEGYRPGGINPIPDPSPFYVKTYQPDRAWNYEVGVKTETPDHRYRADLSLYYINWTNLQILGEPNNPALGFETNAGSAHSEGFEATVTAVPLRGLELNLGLGYADPRLDAPAQGLAKGATLPGVSKLNASLAAQYKWPLFGRWQGVTRADVWSHSNTDTAPAYAQANFRVGVENERFDIMLFVENASDNKLITVTAAEGQFIGRPRTVGVDLRARF